MAVFTRGMSPEEVVNLTAAMVSHSDKLRWNDQQWARVVVDKHSTGGVGDKSSHILAPMVAACGGKVRQVLKMTTHIYQKFIYHFNLRCQ